MYLSLVCKVKEIDSKSYKFPVPFSSFILSEISISRLLSTFPLLDSIVNIMIFYNHDSGGPLSRPPVEARVVGHLVTVKGSALPKN